MIMWLKILFWLAVVVWTWILSSRAIEQRRNENIDRFEIKDKRKKEKYPLIKSS